MDKQIAFRMNRGFAPFASAAMLVIVAAAGAGCRDKNRGTGPSTGDDMAAGMYDGGVNHDAGGGGAGGGGGGGGNGGTGGGGGTGVLVYKTAQLTGYESYPRCCPDSPVYDPGAPTDECTDFSGCKYMGDFAAIGYQTFDYVKSHDLVAFYDDSDPTGSNFDQRYGGKTIHLRWEGKTFDAIIADTCGNQDCNNCCSRNSKHGFLVDMEFWTAERELGGYDNSIGTIEFAIEP
jgi:hypothetical protein